MIDNEPTDLDRLRAERDKLIRELRVASIPGGIIIFWTLWDLIRGTL